MTYTNGRYLILPGSESAHCCFEFTIIDTAAGKNDFGDWNKTMCECFDEEEATTICNALNNINEKKKDEEEKN